ncbi:MAG: response regulator [Myxococcota bacterium]
MPVNVLIVDDSGVMRRMIKRTLGMTGLVLGEIKEAPDGQAGLEEVRSGDFDLALVDVNMPRMNGLEMITKMREEALQVPVVVVSTEGSDDRIEWLRGNGVAFVPKPFTAEGLVDAVVKVFGGRL